MSVYIFIQQLQNNVQDVTCAKPSAWVPPRFSGIYGLLLCGFKTTFKQNLSQNPRQIAALPCHPVLATQSVEPVDVMVFLNTLFSLFDQLTDIYGVHKVGCQPTGERYGAWLDVSEAGYIKQCKKRCKTILPKLCKSCAACERKILHICDDDIGLTLNPKP
eukprot:1162015-Pelagomonas_calceolata.AAC.5